MSCNKYKNCHYKSAVQFYNNVSQDVLATNTVNNPINVSLGSKVTDTGVSIDFSSSNADISKSGLYRISADFILEGGTVGDIIVAVTLNGVVLPETIRTETVGATTAIFSNVHTETVRQLNLCCVNSDDIVGLIAYSDGTAVGAVSSVSGNIVKLA